MWSSRSRGARRIACTATSRAGCRNRDLPEKFLILSSPPARIFTVLNPLGFRLCRRDGRGWERQRAQHATIGIVPIFILFVLAVVLDGGLRPRFVPPSENASARQVRRSKRNDEPAV